MPHLLVLVLLQLILTTTLAEIWYADAYWLSREGHLSKPEPEVEITSNKRSDLLKFGTQMHDGFMINTENEWWDSWPQVAMQH